MTTRRPILALSETVIRKIAAGEVIDRPASIVKELMENAIDAMASRVDIEVREGGLKEITVTDNGIGLTLEDLPLVTVKNATSKIISDEDLLSIDSYGFRGEALASISAVSDFEMITMATDADTGYRLFVRGGSKPDITPIGTTVGTRVRVTDLFFNTPARKKFMRTSRTEFVHVEKTFKKIALAFPHIECNLSHQGKRIWHLPVCQTYRERIAQLYPETLAQHLFDFEASQGPISLQGVGSNMQENLGRPDEIWLFINQRWISDRRLQRAILEGYRSTLMERRFPYAFVFLTMPGHLFDVNVHPTKSEVRFSDPQVLFSMIAKSIGEALKPSVASHRPTLIKSTHPSQAEINTLLTPPFGYPVESLTTLSTLQSPRPSYAHSSISGKREQTDNLTTISQKGFFAKLDYWSQLDGTYLICKNDQELILIDQHAAHERIRYEQLVNEYQKHATLSQQTLIPTQINLSPAQYEWAQEHMAVFAKLGFELEAFGDATFLLRAIPSMLSGSQAQRMFTDLLQEGITYGNGFAMQDFIDHALSTMACHSAVRAHDRLTSEEVNHLLQQMDAVDLTSYCPHGRPTFFAL